MAAQDLVVENLRIDRGGRRIVSDLSFSVPSGGALSVAGRNGAGKSTLLRGLAGLLPLSAGRVRLVTGSPDECTVGECAHYVGHGNGLKPVLSALDNLHFQAAWGDANGIAPAEALRAVDLAGIAHFPVGLLSAGQRRRVALAGLLVSRRTLWLLDEPATALDVSAEALLVSLIRDHLNANGIVIAALHAPLAIGPRTLRLGPE